MTRTHATKGQGILRSALGLVFLIPGIGKLLGGATGIGGLLGQLQFPAATTLGWIVALAEVVFGIMLLVGWKVEWAAWPLVVLVLVAGLTVYWPNNFLDLMPPIAQATFLLHLGVAAGLVSIAIGGPGDWAVDKA